MLLADFQELRELLPGLFVIPVEIARIDPHLLHDGGAGYRRLRREMDIRHERHVASGFPEPPADFRNMRYVLQPRYGNPDQFGTRRRQPQALRHRSLYIIRMCITHRLHHDPAIPDRYLSDSYNMFHNILPEIYHSSP